MGDDAFEKVVMNLDKTHEVLRGLLHTEGCGMLNHLCSILM